mgnify:CR=1 FL=1
MLSPIFGRQENSHSKNFLNVLLLYSAVVRIAKHVFLIIAEENTKIKLAIKPGFVVYFCVMCCVM